MNPKIKSRLKRTAILSVLALAIGAGIGFLQINSQNAVVITPPEPAAGEAVAGIEIGGAFSLTDHNGNAVTEKNFGGYKIIYFGFTMCPMICPTGLQKIAKAVNALGLEGEKIQPLFITIDPERDTPQVMKEYTAQFHPRLTGLTGTKEQIDSAVKSYRVYAAKAEDEGSTEYLMDHSSFIYFMGPDGRLLAIYRDADTAETIAQDIRTRINAGG